MFMVIQDVIIFTKLEPIAGGGVLYYLRKKYHIVSEKIFRRKKHEYENMWFKSDWAFINSKSNIILGVIHGIPSSNVGILFNI